MSKEVVNTGGIASAAVKLRSVNDNINSSFETLKNKAKQLESNWNSGAGSTACTAMYQLFKIGETRSEVIQNYINTLEQQVNPGYIKTEEVNTSLADQFK